MKFQKLPVKRRSVKKGAFRKLFANVANKKKRQRAATANAGNMDGDVPNLGVARALVVMLLIHVVAIAGIFFHSHWLDGESEKAAAAVDHNQSPVVPAPDREDEGMPKIKLSDSFYRVGTGETYEIIAGRLGVAEIELRKANDNVEVRLGRILRIPPKKIVAVEPAAITELRQGSSQPAIEPIHQAPAPALVDTEAAMRADARPESTSSAPVRSASSASHVVKSGDTLWSISQKYGSTVDAVKTANGIDNPRHLKVGMSLTIPQ